MDSILLLTLQLIFASSLAWSCFCRMQRMNSKTKREVRWAVWFESVAALLVLGAPYLPILSPAEVSWSPGETPTWIWLSLLTASALARIATSKSWVTGVPVAFVEK